MNDQISEQLDSFVIISEDPDTLTLLFDDQTDQLLGCSGLSVNIVDKNLEDAKEKIVYRLRKLIASRQLDESQVDTIRFKPKE